MKQNPRNRQTSGQQKTGAGGVQSKNQQQQESLSSLMKEHAYTAQEMAKSMGLDSAIDGAALLGNWEDKRFRQTNKHALFKKMKEEWRCMTQLNRSKIQGLGLYAKKSLDAGIMVIEYRGMLIRPDLAESKELGYDKVGKGTYMFRLNEDHIIDATEEGGPARYINHSCDPNCVAEQVEISGKTHIVIVTNRQIFEGEELSYDYKFDVEDESTTDRVACMCGANNCKRWMN